MPTVPAAAEHVEDRSGWPARLLGAPARLPRPSAVLLVALALVGCWGAAYLAGGARRFGVHWFYLPIMVGAVRFRYRGAILTGVTAAALAGPLMPQDVARGVAQSPGVVATRSFFFLLVGMVIAALVDRAHAVLVHERDLATAERDLANRKAAVMATVSHEFRTPLTVMRGVTFTLEEQGLVAPQGRELVEGLKQATDRLENLISAILAAAERPGTSEGVGREEVDLTELIQRVTERFSRMNGSSRVHRMVAPAVETVETDPQLLEELLGHVVENALKFSPATEPVRVWAEARGGELWIHVCDNGPGIDPEFLEHAFDAFTQQDSSLRRGHEGLGVGLFSAMRLAQRLGGSITLAPYPGRGSEAVLAIPDAVPASHQPAAEVRLGPSVAELG